MNAEKRNARVVVALFGSLTLGASVLLLMEPRPRPADGASQGALLTAEHNPQRFEHLTVEYARSLAGVDRSRIDAVVRPDGVMEWSPRGSSLRVLVVGSGESSLNPAQARTLLELVRWLREQRNFDVREISLDPQSDAREVSTLPGEARQLAQLLEMNGLIR